MKIRFALILLSIFSTVNAQQIKTSTDSKRFLEYVQAYHRDKSELRGLSDPDFLRFIDKLMQNPKAPLTLGDICRLHYFIYRHVDRRDAGRLRTVRVYVNGMTPPHHSFVRRLMLELLGWLNSSTKHPLIKSSEFHLRFVDIHPFINGNGRTARILFALILLKHGYPMPTFRLDQRDEYTSKIHNALVSKNKRPYNNIMLQSVRRSFDNIENKY